MRESGPDGNRSALHLARGLVAAIAGLGLYGLIRFVFNLASVRIFGASFVGEVNLTLSTQTLIAVLWAAIPTVVIAKFVAEARGRDDRASARRIAGGAIAISVIVASLVALASMIVHSGPAHPALRTYGALFGLYLVMRSLFFASERRRPYFSAELIGSLAFFGAFGVACASGNADGAALSLLAHPLVFLVLAMLRLRNEIALHGALSELRQRLKQLGGFAAATFVNALTGLGGFHLAVILAGLFLADPAAVGRLSTLMASLSPLGLLPQAGALVLLPELARRFGSGDVAGQRAVTVGAVLGLQAFAIVAGLPLVLFPAKCLEVMALPPSPELVTTWLILCVATLASVVSSPCGHLLNATSFVDQHAKLSAVFLAIGVVVGVTGIPALGIVGAGLMRASIDGLLAWARMVLAQLRLSWAGRRAGVIVLGQIVLVGGAWAGYAKWSSASSAICLAAGAIAAAILLRDARMQLKGAEASS